MSKDDRVLQKLIDAQLFKIVTVDASLVNAFSSSVWIDQAAAPAQQRSGFTDTRKKSAL